MPKKKKVVEAALESKGFERNETHHAYFIYHTIKDGKKTRARTKTSHTPKMKDIPDNLLSQMAKQCYLTNSQFEQLIDCPLDRREYEAILEKKNLA